MCDLINLHLKKKKDTISVRLPHEFFLKSVVLSPFNLVKKLYKVEKLDSDTNQQLLKKPLYSSK